ncbi:Sodium/hydrogen exchanger [Parathielavia appendiculata]|uniref:Sodium/hydrogen exchanger n=1 Tax=Parathielavia appendiculata TaxID=2587402 RepID=A0AAN6TX68_9PEZI|nr:Sodium/hydrogen exchanger [Parathielavia appendiculata]
MAADGSGAFLAYHEPNIIFILTLVSFFLCLGIAEWLADKLIRAPLIGHITVGLIYGVPLANILAPDWQETFLALGYIGLILIIFEGGLTIRLDLLCQNLVLSVVAALLGVLTPIALSFTLIYAGFNHTPLEAFIVGTALCSTSLGTTFVVLASASKAKPKAGSADPTNTRRGEGVDFSQTRIGTVLVSAAVLDDVCGLVLVSVIHNLRSIADGDDGTSLGWIIVRPVLASGLMALLTPAMVKFIAGPLYRRIVQPRLATKSARLGRVFGILLMAVVLVASLAIAAYAGASVLFGAFLAGAFLSGLPGEMNGQGGTAEFTDTFEHYLGAPQKYVFQPLFFASIGFAIPFAELWTKEVVWKGAVYTILMAFGKLIVGAVVLVWDVLSHRFKKRGSEKTERGAIGWAPATLLGAAMVARGEVGLLIIQIGLNETPYLTRKAFVIGVWAIVLNTIIGPVLVGLLLKRVGSSIAGDARWGVQVKQGSDIEADADAETTGTSAGTRQRPALA